MSLWTKVREFFAGPPLDQRDDLAPDAWDYDPEWPPSAALPDEPERSETEDDRVLVAHEEREPEDRVEIGEPVTDEDGDPIILVGLFSGHVRQGPLIVRSVGKGGKEQEFYVHDDETGVHWPVAPGELANETTHRVNE